MSELPKLHVKTRFSFIYARIFAILSLKGLKTMIISASRRTDLPAFYTPWLLERIRAGFCQWQNPYNPKQRKVISLKSEDVTAFVFWSKNPEPLLPHLPFLDSCGYVYYFQFTLNNYPLLEPGLPQLPSRLDTFRRLSEQAGPARVVWRYDPIIISNATPFAYHLKTFRRLAEALKGATRRVVISFFDYYPKLKPRLGELKKTNGFLPLDPFATPEQMQGFCQSLKRIATRCGMEIFSCCEELDPRFGIEPGACIDGALLAELGVSVKLPKDKAQRKNCLCRSAIDLGAYDTCPHNCL
jgi:hypothetical protein